MELNRERIREICTKENISGVSVAVIENGKVSKTEVVTSKTEEGSMTKDSVFQMGSVSKLVTAWAVLLLHKKGKLDIDAPVNKYLTQWKLQSKYGNADSITIKMILAHYGGINQKSYFGISNADKLETTLQYLSRKKVKVTYEPNIKPIYSGGGYVVLQLLIEEISGMEFSTFVEKFIFFPLDMKSSTFDAKKTDSNNLSNCYGFLGHRCKCYLYSQKAAAGLYSTIGDMSRFAIENMNPNNLVIGEMLEKLQKRYKRTFPNCLGCYAFSASKKKLIASKGINRGWFSCILLLPDEGSSLVYLSNSNRGQKLFSVLAKEWMEDNCFFISREYEKFFRCTAIRQTLCDMH